VRRSAFLPRISHLAGVAPVDWSGWKRDVAAADMGCSNRRMDWPLIAPHFRPDGSLRDIYIEDTTEVDWAAVWGLLGAWTPEPVFKVDGDVQPMPASAVLAWKVARDHSTTVSFRTGDIEVILHFFTIDEIELDIDPAHVCTPEAAQLLETLMADLGAATGKAVLLTQENSKGAWIARFEPASKTLTWNGTRQA
jgi:hypothetical protein